ncbi:MAG: hypothetical protein V1724_02515 [Chloroflexota bacterium]
MVEEKARHEIAEALVQRATELYSPEHAEAMRSYLEQMAAHLWLLSTKAPPREVEPGFFMNLSHNPFLHRSLKAAALMPPPSGGGRR